ncbi:Crp/Fnr family transcriptional regulator [Allohahella marinimesophila]|uniref:Crp/Fnr family transcriptional regulator n=1 Tax=Allohahella marinimesophila TaxID=1054972 RepID=A0ABP7PW23_9GAMM
MQQTEHEPALLNNLQELGLKNYEKQKILSRLARYIAFDKGEAIVKAGDFPKDFFVILSGLARYYYLSPQGKEWNKAFFREGQLIGSLSSFLRRQPCTYTISAIEPCTLAAIPLSIFNNEQDSQLQTLLNRYVREIMLRNEEREALLLTCNNEERYRWLLQHQVWLVSRVPQYQLASYLGMEPVSLSRIKNK